jgi:hypothetical protein
MMRVNCNCSSVAHATQSSCVARARQPPRTSVHGGPVPVSSPLDEEVQRDPDACWTAERGLGQFARSEGFEPPTF